MSLGLKVMRLGCELACEIIDSALFWKIEKLSLYFSCWYISCSTYFLQEALKFSCRAIIRYLTAANACSSLKASSDSYYYWPSSFEFSARAIHKLWRRFEGCLALNSASWNIASKLGSGFLYMVDYFST